MDTIIGSPRRDEIAGSDNAELIQTLAGNDQIYANGGNDTIYGGDGSDEVYAIDGDDILYGQGGDDTLQSGGGNDLVYGGDGNDDIVLNAQTPGEITSGYGGTGDDTISIYDPLDNTAVGGAGLDTIHLASGDFGPGGLIVDFAAGTVFNVALGAGSSIFRGFERLSVSSNFGNDTISAGALDDALDVGRGSNQVLARDGNDLVTYIIGGANTLDGGAGDDTLVASATTSPLYFIVNSFDGTVDDGQLSVISGFETYRANGSLLDDIASFVGGNDTFVGYTGADTAFGNLGNDSLEGGRGADALQGGDGSDSVSGGVDNDSLTGGAGDDRLAGGLGQDVIEGGLGRDRIQLYLGDDLVTGGAGADKFVFYGTETGVHTITDFDSGADRLMFNAALLQSGPAAGPLDPALLSIGAATGAQAQFVLTYDALADQSTLHWDPNGDDPAGGTYALARFTGEITLTAADILIL